MTQSHPTPLSLPADHLGLYLHIPFCARKCRYCDFASRPFSDPTLPDRYLDALAREIDAYRATLTRPVHSIFIGGGTPTMLTGMQLRRLWTMLDAFPRTDDVEISIEANPGTLNDDVLAALARLPLTRVSLGVQSFHPEELAMLGRIHTPQDVRDGVAALRAIGVPQINLDFMYSLPGQTADRWQETLRQGLALQPDHLSCYALILEEGTPLTTHVEAGILPAPGEEEEEAMSRVTAEAYAAAGFTHYEVSNAARPGALCRHNLGYWLGRDYLGLGVAAASTMGGVRWRNTEDVAAYIARAGAGRPVAEYVERLSARERLLERVMLGLRLRNGFDLAEAERACGCQLMNIAGDTVTTLIDEGYLLYTGTVLCLTPQGYPLANMVVTRLMAASAAAVVI